MIDGFEVRYDTARTLARLDRDGEFVARGVRAAVAVFPTTPTTPVSRHRLNVTVG